MAFFSVIIPLYNKEAYIQQTIDSILNQSFTDFELIIVDDASTDDSLVLAKKYTSEKIIFIEHAKNKGLAAARNTGIKQASSSYITFLDADDYWKPNFLKTIHELIVSYTEARIFATNYEEDWNGKRLVPKNGSTNLPKDYSGYIDFFNLNRGQGIYCHGSVCFHRELFEKIGLYNEQIEFSEDIDFNIRANFHFKLAYNTKREMVYAMKISNQITRSSILNKSIPDYSLYANWEKHSISFKKYLDFERYVLAKKLKKSNDTRWHCIRKQITSKNINWKQRLLLQAPVFVYTILDSLKSLLLKFGIKATTY